MDQLKNYDSEFCGKLPIHLINSVQAYGGLLVVNKAGLEIVQTSENLEAVLGGDKAEIVQSSLSRYLSAAVLEELQHVISQASPEPSPAIWSISGKDYFTITHVKADYLLIEIHFGSSASAEQESFLDVYKDLKHAMAEIDRSETTEEVCRVAARQLKRISGFDKVMVYHFDKQWNGTVIAEEMESDMESYYGFTFPASDIPQQARQLYLKNPYRFIPDREAQQSRLYPVINPLTNAFIDLSDCNVRSVAAVHIEYLANMRVMASMSTRILKDEALWGLIACHHKTAMQMSYVMCSVFEMLSAVISARVNSIQNKEKHQAETSLSNIYTKIVEDIYRRQGIDRSLLQDELNATHLFHAGGAALVYNNRIATTGAVPDMYALEDLLLWLHTKGFKGVWHTNSLSREYDRAAEYKDVASGLMVLPLQPGKEYYLLVFRPEVVQEISWGGNPDERIWFDKDEKAYHPRHSFNLWKETIEGMSRPWQKTEIAHADQLRSFIYEFTNDNR